MFEISFNVEGYHPRTASALPLDQLVLRVWRQAWNLYKLLKVNYHPFKGGSSSPSAAETAHGPGGHRRQSDTMGRASKWHVARQSPNPATLQDVTRSEAWPAYLGKWLSPPGNLTQETEQQLTRCGNAVSSGFAGSSNHDCTGNSQRETEQLRELQELKQNSTLKKRFFI